MRRSILSFPLLLVACEQPVLEEEVAVLSEPSSSVPLLGTENTEFTHVEEPFEALEDEVMAFEVPIVATPEQVLVVDTESEGGYVVSLRSGESLVRLAGFADLLVEDIASVNPAIEVTQTLFPGDELNLPLDADAASQFEDRRNAWYDRRVSAYLELHGGLVELESYRMGTGETAWEVARRNDELPMWVLAWFNDARDLDQLGVGDKLSLPILADAVASAEVEADAEPTQVAEVAESTATEPIEEEVQPAGD